MLATKDKPACMVSPNNYLETAAALGEFIGDRSFIPAIPPRGVARAESGETVQALVRWANETKTPLIPVSSGGHHYRGDTAPSVPEALMVDLRGMKRILNINNQQRMAVIEPGVTYGELSAKLEKEGLRLVSCLCPKAEKSVVASLLELEPRLGAMHQWAYTDPLRCMEVTWGDGNRMFTGEAGGAVMDLERQWQSEKWQVEPVGPMMLDFFRLLTGAQGTMGIVTWASVRCELLDKLHKSFVVPAQSYNELTGFIRRLVHLRFSDELFVLSGLQLATLLGKDAADIRALQKQLPAWVTVVGIGGRDLLPEQRVAQQEADIREIALENGLIMTDQITGIPADQIMQKASSPCEGSYWKERLKGGFADIFFVAPLAKTGGFIAEVFAAAGAEGIDPSDIGVYIQPMHCGSAYHLEFTLPYDPDNKQETATVKHAYENISRSLASMNAYFSRPYGLWAELQMNKDAAGKKSLDTLKKIFDPNCIMNPGKLCLPVEGR